MINNLEIPAFTENDIDSLKYINSYWKKSLIKDIKKTNIWTKKFRGDYEQFEMPIVYQTDILISFSEKLVLFRNFLNQKYSIIKTNSRFLNKFRNFISSYCVLVGSATSLKVVCEYLIEMKEKNFDNRSIYFIKKVNKYNLNLLDKFKITITNLIKNDDFINITLNEIFILDEKINVFDVQINQIMQYVNKLYKKKKISEKILTDVGSECIEFASLTNSYSYYCQEFLKRI